MAWGTIVVEDDGRGAFYVWRIEGLRSLSGRCKTRAKYSGSLLAHHPTSDERLTQNSVSGTDREEINRSVRSDRARIHMVDWTQRE